EYDGEQGQRPEKDRPVPASRVNLQSLHGTTSLPLAERLERCQRGQHKYIVEEERIVGRGSSFIGELPAGLEAVDIQVDPRPEEPVERRDDGGQVEIGELLARRQRVGTEQDAIVPFALLAEDLDDGHEAGRHGY